MRWSINLNTTPSLTLDVALLERLFANVQEEGETRRYVRHNILTLKMVRGGLKMALAHEQSFDPVKDYWYRPERRLTVSYMVNRWSDRQVPAEAVRRHALHVFHHMDRARELGLITTTGTDYDAEGGWSAVARPLIHDHARRLPASPSYAQIQRVQPKLIAADEHLGAFMDVVDAQGDAFWSAPWAEPNFARRIRWFPYLGAPDLDTLLERQRFVFAFLHLMTSSNAYRTGGAQGFAPILQNNPWSALLGVAKRWSEGATMAEDPFMAVGNERGERVPRDRSHYSMVLEIYGFLQLDRAPFINQLSRPHYQQLLAMPDATDAVLSEQTGQRLHSLLGAHPELRDRLAAWFSTFVSETTLSKGLITMESISNDKLAARASEQERVLIDAQLLAELDAHATSALSALTPTQAASCAAHLLLDTIPVIARWGNDAPVFNVAGAPRLVVELPSEPAPAMPVMHLPESLREVGERALAYLHAGMHVLLAGAPGTGKTTLAQFIAHAWNRDMRVLPLQLPLDEAPITTVGSSAWTPFHTIGGIVLGADGGFVPAHGIFVDPEISGQAWRLRDEALVLDEMNRADLDRCIGDLYPLLSGSVRQVYPAGIPGVRTIHAAPRFRLIATVNDATLDDIVFPISQGLARRFQRIELSGASQAEVMSFLERDAQPPRLAEAERVVSVFFERARAKPRWTRWGQDREQRLPFGVGWFELLRRWVIGELILPDRDEELPTSVLAGMMLVASLRGALRDETLELLFDELDGES
jgi:MoxR-like ATPase